MVYNRYKLSQAINITSLLIAFSLGLLPLYSSVYVHSWKSSETENRLYIPLVERTPDLISIDIPCTIFDDKIYDWIIEFKGGTAFQIFKDSELGIIVGNLSRTSTTKYQYRIRSNKDNCVIQIEYIKQDHLILITQNNLTEKVVLSDELVVEVLNSIEVNPKFQDQGITVNLRTAPNSDVKETKVRLFVKYILIALILSSVIINLKSFNISKISFKILKDKYLIITLSILSFLNIALPPRIDDGWRIVEASLLRATNVYNNYLVPSPLPTGRLLARINGLALSTNYFPAIRSISVIALFFMWIVIYYLLKNIFSSDISLANIKILTSFFILFISTAFFIGLRGEIYISLIFTLGLLLIVLEKSIPKPNLINFLILSAAIALSIHQSGILMIVVLMTYFILNYKFLSLSNIVSSPFFAFTTGLSAIVLFDHNNVFSAFRNSMIYSYKFDQVGIFGDVSTFNPVGEYERFLRVFTYGSNIFTFTVILIFISFLYLILNQLKINKSKEKRDFIYILLISFTSLFIMPSKWAWYYMVFAPVILISFFYYLVNLKKRQIRTSDLLFIPLIFILTLSVENEIYPLVPSSTLNKFKEPNFFSEFLGFNLQTLILIFALVVFGSCFSKFLTNTRLYLYFVLINLSIIFILFLYGSLSPIISGFLNKSGWSYLSQNAPVKNHNSCGMFSEFGKLPSLVTTNLDFFPLFPCSSPLLFRNGIWDYPLNVIQNFNFLDQQRLAYGIKLVERKCFDFDQPFNDFCLYQSDTQSSNSLSSITILEKQY